MRKHARASRTRRASVHTARAARGGWQCRPRGVAGRSARWTRSLPRQCRAPALAGVAGWAQQVRRHYVGKPTPTPCPRSDRPLAARPRASAASAHGAGMFQQVQPGGREHLPTRSNRVTPICCSMADTRSLRWAGSGQLACGGRQASRSAPFAERLQLVPVGYPCVNVYLHDLSQFPALQCMDASGCCLLPPSQTASIPRCFRRFTGHLCMIVFCRLRTVPSAANLSAPSTLRHGSGTALRPEDADPIAGTSLGTRPRCSACRTCCRPT